MKKAAHQQGRAKGIMEKKMRYLRRNIVSNYPLWSRSVLYAMLKDSSNED
jgi:hypothetical protein